MALADKDWQNPIGTPAPARVLHVWLAVFTSTFVLYGLTASRGIQWQDSGSQILRVVTHELSNPRGLALIHPLHHWLGRLAVSLNIFEPCLAITLVSSLAAALAVANTFGCVHAMTRRMDAALVACFSLAIAHTFWQMATITETYTLVVCLLAGETWCLISFLQTRNRTALWLALALNGLGFANHNLALMTTPMLGVVTFLAIRDRSISLTDVAVGAIIWLLSSLPYTAIVLGELTRSGDYLTTIKSALFGQDFADEVFNVSLASPRLWIRAAFVLLNFPNLLLIAACFGAIRWVHTDGPGISKATRYVIIVGLSLHAVFAFRYPVVDQHYFFLPTYFFLVLLGGVGFASWQRTENRRGHVAFRVAIVLLAATPILYRLVPQIAKRMGVLTPYARHKPYRDDYTYILTPWSIADQSAQRMSIEAVNLAGNDGLIVAEDAMAQPAIRYQLWRLHRPIENVVHQVSVATLRKSKASDQTVVYVPLNTQNPRPPDADSATWRKKGESYVLEELSERHIDASNRP